MFAVNKSIALPLDLLNRTQRGPVQRKAVQTFYLQGVLVDRNIERFRLLQTVEVKRVFLLLCYRLFSSEFKKKHLSRVLFPSF